MEQRYGNSPVGLGSDPELGPSLLERREGPILVLVNVTENIKRDSPEQNILAPNPCNKDFLIFINFF